MPPVLSVAWSFVLFAMTKALPAACRVLVALVTWAFTFLDAHRAAILAFLSWIGTGILSADSWLLTVAKGGLAYFGTSAFAGLMATIKGDAGAVLVDIRGVLEEEWTRIVLGFRGFFPSPAPPPPGPEPAGRLEPAPGFVPPKPAS